MPIESFPLLNSHLAGGSSQGALLGEGIRSKLSEP